MDWIDEKMEQFRSCIRNLPVKKALLSYLCIAAVIAFLLSSATIRICEKWTEILAERQNVNMDRAYTREALFFYYKQSAAGITDREETILILLQEMVRWCPYVYTVLTMMAAGSLFYRKRLQKPFGILGDAVEKVGKKELDFTVAYESEDEMGKLCASFEEMRQNLEENQKEMWNLVEEQKKLNAAFAHDLRTPLTVIRGYSDFLVRYLPKGKISQEKLKDTLRLLSEQAERLERFSGTMKSLRSVDEIPFAPAGKRKQELEMRIQGMVDALNVAKEVKIVYLHDCSGGELILDEDIVMEVLDNLLSNAIRYAKSQVEIETKVEGEFFYLFVSDDGPGFSGEALENASDLYFSEGLKEEHFGIGLSLSDLLCRKHGGEISFANSAWKSGAVVSASFEIQGKI